MNVRKCPLTAAIALVCLSVAVSPPALSAPSEAHRGGGLLQNAGQLPEPVRFYARGGQLGVFLTDSAIVFDLRGVEPGTEPSPVACAVWMRFEGTLAGPARLAGRGERATRIHSFKGRDTTRWVWSIRAFDEVAYSGLWPGVDLVLRSEKDRLVYRLESVVGGDPGRVRFAYEGADRIVERPDGSERIETAAGTLVHVPPADGHDGVIFTEPAGFLPAAVVDPSARTPSTDQDEVPPELAWSTYVSSEEWFSDNIAQAIALDSSDAPVIVGRTNDLQFPTTPGAYDISLSGMYDVFVAKLLADGSDLEWGTYIGDIKDEEAVAVRLDSADRPVVAGITESAIFPTTVGAFDRDRDGSQDGFVLRLSADGSMLEWSTYLGGDGDELLETLMLTSDDRPVVGGSTESATFPTTPGAYQQTLRGSGDAFVTELLADGSDLAWSTLLGGGASESIRALDLGPLGRVYIGGDTYSGNFPTTTGAYDTGYDGSGDAFVAIVEGEGSTLTSSTYLGGTGQDIVHGLALSDEGEPVVTGMTRSAGFPTTEGVLDRTLEGPRDGFVTRLLGDASGLVWSTLIGGTSGEIPYDLALTPDGRPVITGLVFSADFPTTADGFDVTHNGGADAFVAGLDEQGRFLIFSTFLGSTDYDEALAVALDSGNTPIVAGDTRSTNGFPTTPGAFMREAGPFAYDTFVSKLLFYTGCLQVLGGVGPEIHVVNALSGTCPPPDPPGLEPGQQVDVIQGFEEQLAGSDIGDVRSIACAREADLYQIEPRPMDGDAFFYLVRYTPGGDYTEGAESGLVGARLPLSGDCP
ncbi:MAG: hypothetical protein JSV80_10715 [Acidobacteriota bacterium]|nr:MAG: hypothetical protein JSV80_10715 [Acidobacteriota bacterium]